MARWKTIGNGGARREEGIKEQAFREGECLRVGSTRCSCELLLAEVAVDVGRYFLAGGDGTYHEAGA